MHGVLEGDFEASGYIPRLYIAGLLEILTLVNLVNVIVLPRVSANMMHGSELFHTQQLIAIHVIDAGGSLAPKLPVSRRLQRDFIHQCYSCQYIISVNSTSRDLVCQPSDVSLH